MPLSFMPFVSGTFSGSAPWFDSGFEPEFASGLDCPRWIAKWSSSFHAVCDSQQLGIVNVLALRLAPVGGQFDRSVGHLKFARTPVTSGGARPRPLGNLPGNSRP